MQEILVPIAYAQKLPINANTDVSKGARDFFGMGHYLRSCFVYASSEALVSLCI